MTHPLNLERRDHRGELLQRGDRVRITHDFDQPRDVNEPTKGRWFKLTTQMVGEIVGEQPAGVRMLVTVLMRVKFPRWKTPHPIAALDLVKLDVIDAVARANGGRRMPMTEDEALVRRNKLTSELMDLRARAEKIAEDLGKLHEDAMREAFANAPKFKGDRKGQEPDLVDFRHVYAAITCWAEARNPEKVAEALDIGRTAAEGLKRGKRRVLEELDRMDRWAACMAVVKGSKKT